jgi:hypothetical protein
MERTMLNDSKLSNMFWKEAIHNAFNILNICFLIRNHDKTPYELWKGRPATINYLKVFGSKCYIKRSEVLIRRQSPMLCIKTLIKP